MPKIQLIRKDSSIIELDAEEIGFSIQRMVAVYPIPIVATRAALDLNQSMVTIKVSGILTDDEQAVGATGAVMSMDFSVGMGAIGGSSWWASAGSYAWGTFKTAILDHAEIVFRSAGQISAGAGEDITIRLSNGAIASTVATNSVIGVNIASTTNTQTLATAIATALGSANVHVGGVSTAFSSIFSVSQKPGQATAISYQGQTGSSGTYAGELIEIRNTTKGAIGNSSVVVQRYALASGNGMEWRYQPLVTDFTGGAASQKMTRGDKLQDLLNMTVNPSPGGALISPQVMSGSLIDLPDSIASLDASQFLRISESKAVQKYVVGIRVPYESIITSTTGDRVLRQFLIPAGPGTDHSAESNTESFDPKEEVDGKTVRPNPFLRQGVAIPAIIVNFDPIYAAGDSVWTYDLTLNACEQLVGI